jgi:hypothetical protein
MADSSSSEPTHNAYTTKRAGKKVFRWIQIGTARYDEHSGVFHAFLDVLPIGGFNGYVYFSPRGVEPPLPEPEQEAEESQE